MMAVADTLAKHLVLAASIVAISMFSPDGARAQPSIGSAASTQNNVARDKADGVAGGLSTGDAVFRDDLVRTGADSTAKLIFLDSTNLAIGPTSRVKLDRFVFDADPSAQAVAVRLAKGMFRFSTGSMDKRAYAIETPTAAIGVRGTILDIDVGSGRTRVTLVEGRALVCPLHENETSDKLSRCWPTPGKPKPRGRNASCDCLELRQAGQTAAVTAKGSTRASYSLAPVDFASLCAGDPSLCSSSSYADLGQNGGASLCGR